MVGNGGDALPDARPPPRSRPNTDSRRRDRVKGAGRSGGFRAIVLFRRGERAFFIYGLAKNDRENLRRDERKAFRMLAGEMLGLDEAGLEAALANGTIIEVGGDG